MKALYLLLFLSGCVTIDDNDWYFCETVCGSHTEEATRTMIDGLKCRCEFGGIIDVGEPPRERDYFDYNYEP